MNTTTALVLAFSLPCLMTTLGALLIFFFKKPSKLVNLISISLASGIMLSASIWSLLLPAIENGKTFWGQKFYIFISISFVFGAFFMIFLDFLCKNHFKTNKNMQKPFKFFVAITVHNIPEGLSVGVAMGTAIILDAPIAQALAFAIGIAIQNFPEGLATAIPIQNCIKNERKSFFWAFLSGLVEPLFALLGFFLAKSVSGILYILLSFAAGAMIYIVIEELTPELYENKNGSIGSILFIVGFLTMMLLDICL